MAGCVGVLIANFMGAALAGRALVTFPVIVVLRQHGVGEVADTVALLTSWSVLALHRVLAYELPMLGPRFVALRLTAAAPTPFVAGALAGLIWLALAPGVMGGAPDAPRDGACKPRVAPRSPAHNREAAFGKKFTALRAPAAIGALSVRYAGYWAPAAPSWPVSPHGAGPRHHDHRRSPGSRAPRESASPLGSASYCWDSRAPPLN